MVWKVTQQADGVEVFSGFGPWRDMSDEDYNDAVKAYGARESLSEAVTRRLRESGMNGYYEHTADKPTAKRED